MIHEFFFTPVLFSIHELTGKRSLVLLFLSDTAVCLASAGSIIRVGPNAIAPVAWALAEIIK